MSRQFCKKKTKAAVSVSPWLVWLCFYSTLRNDDVGTFQLFLNEEFPNAKMLGTPFSLEVPFGNICLFKDGHIKLQISCVDFLW